jgi:hypothetical protein
MAREDDSLIVRKRAADVLAAHALASFPPVDVPSSQASQDAQEREKQQAQELLEEEQRRQAEGERLRREQEAIRLKQEQERQAQEAEQARLARLEDLYNSVLSKIQAGEWQAAQSSLEELQRLQPDYGEAAKLRKQIAEGIARQKSERERQERQAQQRRLEARYQDASQAMQREDWPEAQRLFEQLAQEAPGYRDVTKHLKVIAGRLAGEPVAAPTRRNWLPVLVTSLGWGIAWAVLVPLVEAYRFDNIYLVATIPALLIAGGVTYSLMLAGLPLSRARLAQLFLLWWGGSALFIGFAVYPDWQDRLVMTAVIPIALMLATFAGTGLLLRASIPSLRWIFVAGGWILGLIGGFVALYVIFSVFFKNGLDSIQAYALALGLGGLVAGAIGGGWMHRQLLASFTPAKEQAGSLQAGSPIAASTWRNWLPVVIPGLGWGIAWAVLGPFVNNDQIFLGATIPGLFMAASTVAGINMITGPQVSQKRLAQVFALLWGGIALALGLAAYPDWQGYPIQGVVIPIALILATFAGSGLLLRLSIPSVGWMSIFGGLVDGAIAGAIAMTVIRPAFPYVDLHLFGLHDLGGMPVLGFGGLVGGLISGGWIRWQLRRGQSPTKTAAPDK